MSDTLKQIFHSYNEPVKKTYLDIYELLFTPVREQVRKVLEIGVWEGNSLRKWRDFFPNAQVYGWDLNRYNLNEPRITTMVVDHDNHQQVEGAFQAIGGDIDIIIEDGSHMMKSQQLLLLWCMSQVRPGGLYISEDIGTSRRTVGRQWGLDPNETNSTYELFSGLMIDGTLSSHYFSKDEMAELKRQIAQVFMFSTIRKDGDGIPDYGLSSWPTFPICVFRKIS